MKDEPKPPRSFRVPISIPTASKVAAVAAYKRRCGRAMAEAQQREAPAPPQTIAAGTPEHEEAVAKLEALYTKGQEVRQELQSLNGVRCSLMWLLKKSAALETLRNHGRKEA